MPSVGAGRNRNKAPFKGHKIEIAIAIIELPQL